MRRTCLGSVALWLVGGCTVLAGHGEYALYRSYRGASGAEQRAALGAQYLASYPNGEFAPEVEREVGPQEAAAWERGRGSIEGVQAYLRVYPSGRHAAEARAQLRALGLERERQEAQREAARAAAQREQEARQRAEVRQTIATWLRALAALEAWGEPPTAIAQRDPEFNRFFGAEPVPRCTPARCRKSYRIDFGYSIPGRTAVSRQLAFSLDLLLREGRAVQAALAFHRRGLSTWYEFERHEPVDVSNADQRAASTRWALEQLRAVVADALPTARQTPPELLGPEPEMEGAVDEDGEGAQPAQPAVPIPPQPLGTQWSYVVGCGDRGGAPIAAPDAGQGVAWGASGAQPAPVVRSCLRIDGYAAPDIEGTNTDEGLRVTWIAPSVLAPPPPPAPTRPARPARRPARAPRRGR